MAVVDHATDPRVDAYIDALPQWQQAICRELRGLVHATDPDVTETIKFRDRPYFVLQGNVCALLAARTHVNLFLYDGAIVDDAEGIITGGHDNTTASRSPSTPTATRSISPGACCRPSWSRDGRHGTGSRRLHPPDGRPGHTLPARVRAVLISNAVGATEVGRTGGERLGRPADFANPGNHSPTRMSTATALGRHMI